MQDEYRQFLLYMKPGEWIALVLVFGGTAALWGAEFALLWRTLRARWRRVSLPAKTKPLRVAVHLLAAVYLACFLYARLIEPDRLALKRLTISSAKIPAGVTLRIAHVTDLHARGSRVKFLARVGEAVARLEPDLICLTGDYLCGYRDGEPAALLAFLLRLPDVPVFAVTGNYGGVYMPDAFLDQLGAETLHTERRLPTIKGVPLELLGASPTRVMTQVSPRLHPERYGIFLEHFPAVMPAAARAGWDLFLAGHTHGGQVRLPLYGALLTLDRAGKTFEMGGYRVGDTVGHVSAGVGLECRGMPLVRFLCPPEITLIQVRGAAHSSK
ncbi:MAG TPA: metallophosphoesterase [bacterium]|nr:metallophosphoesterase [bacterium]